MPKMSVIIPVYNNAVYLPQCLDSLLSQSFPDFEGIIVDDGSYDGSETICDEYQKRDCRLKVIHIENHGVSHARNVGLDNAKGEWVSFVDSDDWIDPDYLSTLYEQIDNDTDVVIGNLFFNIGEKQITKVCSKPLIRKKNFPSFPLATLVPDCGRADNLYVSMELLSSACNKLTRKSLLEKYHIRFNEQIYLNEDGLFHLNCYIRAKDFVILDTPLYHYRIRLDSSNYKYRPFVHEQDLVVKDAFSVLSDGLPDDIKEAFNSLCAYRIYLNTMSLWIEHSQNKHHIIKKIRLLRDDLKTGLYEVSVIPQHLSLSKKVELKALQRHWCLILLFMARIRRFKNRLLYKQLLCII